MKHFILYIPYTLSIEGLMPVWLLNVGSVKGHNFIISVLKNSFYSALVPLQNTLLLLLLWWSWCLLSAADLTSWYRSTPRVGFIASFWCRAISSEAWHQHFRGNVVGPVLLCTHSCRGKSSAYWEIQIFFFLSESLLWNQYHCHICKPRMKLQAAAG